MLCKNCNKNEATFHYTEIINGIKKEIALCDECRGKLGISSLDFNIPLGIPDFFSDFFEESTFMPEYESIKPLKCNECGMSYNEFIEGGRVGCSNCYNAFESKLDSILKNIHGSNIYKGRALNSPKLNKIEKIKEESKNNEIEELKNKLKELVKEEKYEEAAKIRDEIKKIENSK
ncbi:MAG: UvrB/UvrC motif-containing protein [Clostridia bacterium]|nr:UvrB/UvrC motif-containing protein [Clostridia bacterium]